MKKIIIALAVVAAFVSCGKDNSVEKRVAKLEVVFNLETISQDILDNFDLTLNYVDFEGRTSSNPITGPVKYSFSKLNPNLGEEESCPFTVELKVVSKGKSDKGSAYDANMKYNLFVNGYYPDGSVITDSGSIINWSGNGTVSTLSALNTQAKQFAIEKITYKTFFCQTISGEWHIGVRGKKVQ